MCGGDDFLIALLKKNNHVTKTIFENVREGDHEAQSRDRSQDFAR